MHSSQVPLRRENRKSLNAEVEIPAKHHRQQQQQQAHRHSGLNHPHQSKENSRFSYQSQNSQALREQQQQDNRHDEPPPTSTASEAESSTAFNEQSSSQNEDEDLPNAKDFEKMHAFKVCTPSHLLKYSTASWRQNEVKKSLEKKVRISGSLSNTEIPQFC